MFSIVDNTVRSRYRQRTRDALWALCDVLSVVDMELCGLNSSLPTVLQPHAAVKGQGPHTRVVSFQRLRQLLT